MYDVVFFDIYFQIKYTTLISILNCIITVPVFNGVYPLDDGSGYSDSLNLARGHRGQVLWGIVSLTPPPANFIASSLANSKNRLYHRLWLIRGSTPGYGTSQGTELWEM